MVRRFGLLLVLGSIMGMAACGGGGSSSSTVTGVSVSCSPSTVSSGGTSQCSATVSGTGSFSTSVTWTASAGSVSSSGVLTAPVVTSQTTVTVTATSTQNTSISGTASVTVTTNASGANVAPLTVDAGPAPQTFTSVDVAFVTITVCVPGSSSQCQTIDHVMVDTGSSGLRLMSSAAGGEFNPSQVPLPAVTDPNNNEAFGECLVFLDGYVWGTVNTATVTVSGETATSVPVQVILPSSSSPAVPSSCSSQNPSGGAGNEGNSLSDFGANGLIGVGLFQQDCGQYCVTQGSSCNGSNNAPCLYYDCPSSGCTPANIALTQQVPNPVTMFATDNNGVLIALQSVGDGGVSTASGSLIFGIGTESNNQLNSATIYQVPDSGNDAGDIITTFNGTQYQGFLDSGSNGLYFLDSSISGVPATCTGQNSGWYCPSTSPDNLTASNQGQNASGGTVGNPVTVNFSIENANNLFNTNNSAFSTLGGPLAGPPPEFDWGLAFFFGKNVFTAIDTMSTPAGDGPYFAY
jgi:hypothetical protein